jgi:hypothetical protein
MNLTKTIGSDKNSRRFFNAAVRTDAAMQKNFSLETARRED